MWPHIYIYIFIFGQKELGKKRKEKKIIYFMHFFLCPCLDKARCAAKRSKRWNLHVCHVCMNVCLFDVCLVVCLYVCICLYKCVYTYIHVCTMYVFESKLFSRFLRSALAEKIPVLVFKICTTDDGDKERQMKITVPSSVGTWGF